MALGRQGGRAEWRGKEGVQQNRWKINTVGVHVQEAHYILIFELNDHSNTGHLQATLAKVVAVRCGVVPTSTLPGIVDPYAYPEQWHTSS